MRRRPAIAAPFGTRALLVAAALILCGCGLPHAPADGSPGASFPHPESYADTHPSAAGDGDLPCGTCHGLRDGDPVAGAAPTAPSCRSCHGTYPHPRSLASGAAHGPAWMAGSADCARCHGEAGDRPAGGTERGRCTSCHSTYPHSAAWPEGDGHGAAARKRGLAACASCHGRDGAAVPDAACSECHEGVPHVPGFAQAGQHGPAYRAAPESCAACHEANEAAPERLRCRSCHDLFPHGEGWAQEHLAATQERGLGSCLACHPAGVEGPVLPGSCGAICHDGGAP